MSIAGEASCSRRCGRSFCGESAWRAICSLNVCSNGAASTVSLVLSTPERDCESAREPVGPVLSVLCRASMILLSFLLFVTPFSAVGATWSNELQIHADDNYSDWAPQLAVDSAGTPWIVWMGLDPVQLDEEIYVTKWTDGHWAPRQRLHSDNVTSDRFPEIATGKLDGVPWVVWARWNGYTSNYDFLVSRLTASGWAVPETVFVAGSRYDAYDIVARDTSLVWVAWSTRDHGGVTQDRDILARKRENGVWGEIEQILKPVMDDWRPRIDLDSAGNLWTVWDATSEVFSAVRSDTGWSQPVLVKHDVGGSIAAFVAVDESDVPWMVWSAGNAYGGTDVLSARWETSAWVELGMVNAPDDPEDVDNNPVITAVPGSGPLAIWWGGLPAMAACMDVYESKWTASGWRQEGHVSTPDSVFIALDESPSAAVGPGGRTWVCWMRMDDVSPYDYDIWARYSDDVVAIEVLRDFEATTDPSGVHLSWFSEHYGQFEVYRKTVSVEGGNAASTALSTRGFSTASERCASSLPSDSELLTELPLVGRGQFAFDDTTVLQGSAYLYWVARLIDNECVLYGPFSVDFPKEAGPISPRRRIRVSPNPFGSMSLIVSPQGDIAEIYDLQGRFVRRIFALEGPDADNPASCCSFRWDGKDQNGRRMASGVYIVRVIDNEAPEEKEAVGKIILLR